ncbi:unnamed protein product [Nyctereutes procyonoides]|uniref:Small nuclear ribonucleoprotein E n=1 Tax=Nyctereutes procyonoides TaxID=34880 RepID=A0A811YGA5_NYCPR|nr:unnamed protein product [Nyctereutes procyonoides]
MQDVHKGVLLRHQWKRREENQIREKDLSKLWKEPNVYQQMNKGDEECVLKNRDTCMNLVLDDAEEIHSKTKARKQLGQIMLKGDNITLLQSVSN